MTFLGLPSARTAQLVASTGLDGVIIDLTAIASQGVSPLVRLRMTHADLIKRALDAGAHGIVVPMINTPEDARNVVQHAKFPPQGLRGQGSAFPGFAFGVDIPTYMAMANETVLICLQIESKLGVENVDAICAVPGVGPNDLALSILGYAPARGNEPEFNDAIEKIIAVARKHGKWIGRLSNDGDSARKHLEIFDTVALGYDVRAIQNWYLAELKSARSSQ
ncbi:Pyruvate/Phosphoenolpyruvate kinase-like domain-containing protein [Fusarium oxysporum]|nr:Pyruvate/Phosphoenolpyruvate kinase-like domain-containing protein [Fusarium oxysporum]